jgi:hypothetical protein
MTSIGLVARLGLAKGIDDDVQDVLGRPQTSFTTFVATIVTSGPNRANRCGSGTSEEPYPFWPEPSRLIEV